MMAVMYDCNFSRAGPVYYVFDTCGNIKYLGLYFGSCQCVLSFVVGSLPSFNVSNLWITLQESNAGTFQKGYRRVPKLKEDKFCYCLCDRFYRVNGYD